MNPSPTTILVVEDDPNDREFIERAFTRLGVTSLIRLLANGEEAIAYMMGEGKYADRENYPYPTFIITDLKLPIKDGFAVLEHLKANPAWAIIPTVVLTGSSDPDDVRTAYLLGASSYHLKPASFDDLVGQLRILYQYWMTCQIPVVDESGRQVRTLPHGKLGRRFPQPDPTSQVRVVH